MKNMIEKHQTTIAKKVLTHSIQASNTATKTEYLMYNRAHFSTYALKHQKQSSKIEKNVSNRAIVQTLH